MKKKAIDSINNKIGKIMKSPRLKGWIISAEALALVLVIGFLAIGIYLADVREATDTALAAMSQGKTNGKYTVFEGSSDKGIVFYPGGKVDCQAYAPLLKRLADKGVTCVLAKMPFNLAILDQNAYKGAVKEAPNITNWYIGGHSLGGAVATFVLNDRDAEFISGAVLLAAYPSEPIDVPVLSVTASLDGVMDKEKYNASKDFCLGGITEYEIKGGNHAGFGSYGTQSGDGTATISANDQLDLTADYIFRFINGELS